MTLDDIEYVKKDGSYKVLGKGSYGEVELATIIQHGNIETASGPTLPKELIGK